MKRFTQLALVTFFLSTAAFAQTTPSTLTVSTNVVTLGSDFRLQLSSDNAQSNMMIAQPIVSIVRFQRYVDQWGNPASIWTAGGHWVDLDVATTLRDRTISTLDYGIGKFGFRAIEGTRTPTLGFDVDITASCSSPVIVRAIATEPGTASTTSSNVWKATLGITACQDVQFVDLTYGAATDRKDTNRTKNNAYYLNGQKVTSLALGNMKAGQTLLVNVEIVGTVPRGTATGTVLNINPSWFAHYKIAGSRTNFATINRYGIGVEVK